MSKYEDPTQLDYRYGGDTVDDFAQKYMKTVAYIFSALNELRSPTGGTLTQNPEAYQLKVDDNKLYIRNQANTDWILLGDVQENFGFRTSASDAFMHESDVADSGTAGKLIRADASGKLNADILGNAAKIADKAIQMGLDLADEDRLVYDKDTDTITNRPLQFKVDGDKIYARKDATTGWVLLGDLKQNLGFRSSTDDAFLTESDVADNGTAGKLIRADVNGKLNTDILGNARKMAGKTFAPEALQDGQIPVYRTSDGTWHAENKGTVGAGKNLMIMDGDKMLGEYNGDEMKAIDIQKSSLTKALAESTGYGIVSGCEPSISGLTVTVGAGVVHLAGGTRKEIAETTQDIRGCSAIYTSRNDIIYIKDGGVTYIVGTESSNPDVPAFPITSVPICVVHVMGDTGWAEVIDKRIFINDLPAKIEKNNPLNIPYELGACLGWETDTNLFKYMINSGIKHVRIGVTWGAVEKTAGVYDFSTFDYALKIYHTFNVQPCVLLAYGNSLYGKTYNTQAFYDAFAAYAAATVQYFKNHGFTGLVWEVWNEPSITWSNNDLTTMANEYVTLLKKAYTAIKNVDSTAIVAGWIETYGPRGTWNVTALKAGMADYCDVFDAHLYPENLQPPENTRYRLTLSKLLIEEFTQKEPLFISTESGYTIYNDQGGGGVCTDENRPAWLTRMILIHIGEKSIIRTYIYQMASTYASETRELGFGLLKNSNGTYTQTTAYTAVKNLSNALNGFEFERYLIKSPTINIMLFSKKDGAYKIAYWTTNTSQLYSIGGKNYKVTNMPQFADVEYNDIANISAEKTIDVIPITKGTGLRSIVANNYALNKASGEGSASFGSGNNVSGGHSFSAGYGNNVTSSSATAVGQQNTVSGNYGFSTGFGNSATGEDSTAGGNNSAANGFSSFAHGVKVTASGYGAAAFGLWDAKATGQGTFALGENNEASNAYSMVMGRFVWKKSDNDIFTIGNGSPSGRSNAFRVTKNGDVYGISAYNSGGADYAEYFEWSDGNADSEDRVGYFVTLDHEKIRIAKSTDGYILGIVSGNASVIGNSYNDQWKDMYVTDDFGRIQYEDVEVADVTDSEGTIIIPAHIEKRMKINPDYDNTQEYIGRENRKEWSAVGMLGVLPVRDDGTCEVNGYCKVADGGIATKANSGYRVVARVADNIIKVLFR